MEKKFFLTVDTSLKGISVSLFMQEQSSVSVLSSQYFFTNQIAAAKMPTILSHLLKIHDVEYTSLECVGISTGPGSFTGIKVGMSFIGGFALGQSDLRRVGISPLESLAHYHPDSAWFLPATKKQGYLGISTEKGPGLFVVDIVNGHLELASEHGRQPITNKVLQNRKIHILLPWELLMGALNQLEMTGVLLATEGSAMLIQEAMIKAITERNFLCAEVSPRYVRKSAPEELSTTRR